MTAQIARTPSNQYLHEQPFPRKLREYSIPIFNVRHAYPGRLRGMRPLGFDNPRSSFYYSYRVW